MDQSSTAEEVWIPILFSNSICESMAQFRRIRPDRLTTSYPGVAQLVARLLWEREAQARAVVLGKPGKPWDSWADSTFHLAGNWSKIGVDHMFDHNWKISYPGVAQLVARLLWEREAQVRAAALGKPRNPWDTWADSTSPIAGNWSKIGVDHMFDHNWKIP